MRWKEEGFSYESDPISHFKGVKADKELFLEMAFTLRESGVKLFMPSLILMEQRSSLIT